MGNTAKTLAMAAALTLSAAANAAVTTGTEVNTPFNFSISIDYLPSTSIGGYETYSTTGNWYAYANFIPVGTGIEVITGSMQHLVAPHVGELAPNPNVFNFVFIVSGGNGGPFNPFQASFAHPDGQHFDAFSASIGNPTASGYPYSLNLTGSHPVPEPQQFAVLAGLGLLGFGVYRRMRS